VTKIEATVLGPELTGLLLASRPAADQLPEIGRVDPHAAPLGTFPVTVTVIDAVAPSASEAKLHDTTWPEFFEVGLIVTGLVAGSVVAEAPDSHPAVPPWIFIA
jgi:hypothetical protein